jgi:two-component system NtrC family sensor kinase
MPAPVYKPTDAPDSADASTPHLDAREVTTDREAEFNAIRAALEAEVAAHRTLTLTLERERSLLRTMIDLIPAVIYAKDLDSRFIACNELVARGMGTTPVNVVGKTDFDFYPREMAQQFFADEQAIIKSGKALIDHEEQALDQHRGTLRVILTSKVPVRDNAGNIIGIVGTGRDITERKEAEQRQAAGERLESIGRLAAGVAHEINTPVQYVSDSAVFIRDGMHELLAQFDKLQAARYADPDPDSDLSYLQHALPGAIDRVLDGLSRITEIVRSMKYFSHPEQREMRGVDLNRAIHSTLVIARSEYKNVAELQTDFAELPLITCHGGQINQVVLNLVLNAAHSVADAVRGTPDKGRISITTVVEGPDVVIRISDTGRGIPEAIRHRVFEPFFTTKELGKGTGQGLSIARDVVVQGHGGSLTFQTETGKGTTFCVRLPIVARTPVGLP